MLPEFNQCQQSLADITAIDYFLAKTLIEYFPASDKTSCFYTCMALSQALRQGHSCLKLPTIANSVWAKDEDKCGYLFPALDELKATFSPCQVNTNTQLPVVLEFDRLYLRKYWVFESELASFVSERLTTNISVDIDCVKQSIEQLFPEQNSEFDWQKVAVANAANKKLAIIAGGPGTGKTTTVTKLLALVLSQSTKPLKIAMAAPTGKAAQRLNESVNKSKQNLFQQGFISQAIYDQLNADASTIHRLLGVKHNSHNFKHHQHNPLDLDVLLLDEISMIDLPLMTRIFRALPAHTRVIMLGDADQLPSVAAGSILADLSPYKQNGFSPKNQCFIESVINNHLPTSDVTVDHVTNLQKSFRFKGDGGIGRLAAKVIQGLEDESWQLLQAGDNEISLVSASKCHSHLEELAKRYYQPLLTMTDINLAFEQLNQFRILSAVKQSDKGVQALNQHIESLILSCAGLSKNQELYHGKPVMVVENRHDIELYNGDIGLVWQTSKGLTVAFIHASGEVRYFAPGKIPKFETVYAMTIHKTQGSEFEQVAMVLPDKDSAILTRELLYTGITRAKSLLSICCEKNIWQTGVSQKIKRYSGLSLRLFSSK